LIREYKQLMLEKAKADKTFTTYWKKYLFKSLFQ
jgi:hypothetical protein